MEKSARKNTEISILQIYGIVEKYVAVVENW